MVLLASCAWTEATLELPDGTRVYVWDNKSREGVIVNWEKTENGYAVFLSSQKSGTDPEIAKLAGKMTDVIGKAVERVPVVP